MKGLSPLRREETFPKKPLRDFPQSHQLELVHMPNKSLARGLVTSTEIYSWTREEITILRAMWLMGSCLNRIEVMVAGGEEERMLGSHSSQPTPLYNMHPQFHCSYPGLCTAYKRMRTVFLLSSAFTIFPLCLGSPAPQFVFTHPPTCRLNLITCSQPYFWATKCLNIPVLW